MCNSQTSLTTSITVIRAFLIFALASLFACERKEPPKPPPPPAVTVAHPEMQRVTEWMNLTGNTEAYLTVQLRARVSGVLEQVLFNEGEMVKEGQLLFVIQQNTYRANLAQAEGSVAQLQAQLEYATREVKRFSELVRQKGAAQTDLDNWIYQRDSAGANLISARARRDLAKLDLGYTEIKAPFDGRIGRKLVDTGNLVGAGEPTVLAVIYKVDPIYAYFSISDTDLAIMEKAHGPDWWRDAEKCPVFMGVLQENGTPHRGKLDFSSVNVSPTTGTMELRGVFQNPDGKIPPGLFARIRLRIRETTALLVPQVSVGTDARGDYVMVVNEQDMVERRDVKTGWPVNQQRVTEAGLSVNDRVVVNGIQKAAPGRKVSPQMQTPRAKAAS